MIDSWDSVSANLKELLFTWKLFLKFWTEMFEKSSHFREIFSRCERSLSNRAANSINFPTDRNTEIQSLNYQSIPFERRERKEMYFNQKPIGTEQGQNFIGSSCSVKDSLGESLCVILESKSRKIKIKNWEKKFSFGSKVWNFL